MQRALPAVVSIAVLAWLFAQVDGQGLVDALTWRVAAVIVPATLLYGAASLLLEAWAIRALIEHPPPGLSLSEIARIKCASYLLGIVNYALGGAALAVLLQRRTRLTLGQAGSLVLLISATDFAVVLAVVGIGAAFVEAIAPGLRVGLLVVGIASFVIGLFVLRVQRSLGRLDHLRTLPIFHVLRTAPLPELAKLVVIRTAFVLCFVGISTSAFIAFETPAPFPEIVVGMLVVGFVAGLPIAIAGLGTSQVAFLQIFEAYASEETLLAQSLVLSTSMLLLRALMGLVFAREYTREALRERRDA
jgi:hypothetical protein